RRGGRSPVGHRPAARAGALQPRGARGRRRDPRHGARAAHRRAGRGGQLRPSGRRRCPTARSERRPVPPPAHPARPMSTLPTPPVAEQRLFTRAFVTVVAAGLAYFLSLGMLLPVVPRY